MVYLLARETFLIEDLRTSMILPRTNASEQLLTTLRERREATPEEFYGTGAMIDRQWTRENCELRHVITRLAVHGFHHRICKTTAYHEPNDLCECSLCGNKCERYHIIKRTIVRFINMFQNAQCEKPIFQEFISRVLLEIEIRGQVFCIVLGPVTIYIAIKTIGLLYLFFNTE